LPACLSSRWPQAAVATMMSRAVTAGQGTTRPPVAAPRVAAVAAVVRRQVAVARVAAVPPAPVQAGAVRAPVRRRTAAREKPVQARAEQAPVDLAATRPVPVARRRVRAVRAVRAQRRAAPG
jgi:hypothetical protein